MKKVLLGTTALVTLFAGSAMAETPTVSLGGFLDFQAGVVDQDNDAGQRDVLFQNDTEVHVKVNGKSDNGLGYGAVIELEADVSADADNEGLNADKTYLFVEGGFGRVEAGNNTDAAAALRVDASSFARATGGIDGDFYDFINLPAGTLYTPALPTEWFAGVQEDATKITYYSPRFSGVQVGVSYTPDQGNGGTAAGFTGDANGDYENVINAGINYTAQYDQVGVAASLTGEIADNELSSNEDLRAWAAGATVSFAGFSFGGSYGDWNESVQVTPGAGDSDYWTVGAGYEQGPVGVSLTYLDSESPAVDFQNIVLGADYQLAPGLVPYVEVSFFDADAAGTLADNDGNVVLIGTELSF